MNLFPKSFALSTVAVAAALVFAPAANAALISVNSNTTVQGSPITPPATPTSGISTIDLTGKVGATNFTLNTGSNSVTVNTTGATSVGGGVVQGSSANAYAAPVTGASGATVTTPYFSTGGTPGTITLTFASVQSYLGLLWGSIGIGDYITFKSAGATIATVTGTNAMNAAVGFNGANGAQGFGGSQYTLVNFLNGTTFDTVILGQSGQPSFESANFEYAARNVAAVPEPGVIGLLGIGIAGLAASRRRKVAKV